MGICKFITGISTCLMLCFAVVSEATSLPETITISKTRLLDKIKGGWPARLLESVLEAIQNSDIKEHLSKIIRQYLGQKDMY